MERVAGEWVIPITEIYWGIPNIFRLVVRGVATGNTLNSQDLYIYAQQYC